MKALLIRHDINLLPKPNEYQLILDSVEPPPSLTTSAFILAFKDDRLLMSKLVGRGWDIPGGHVETGETPDETARRELYEETGATVEDVQLLGYDKFVIHGPVPEGYRYPTPISYQLFYCAALSVWSRSGQRWKSWNGGSSRPQRLGIYGGSRRMVNFMRRHLPGHGRISECNCDRQRRPPL